MAFLYKTFTEPTDLYLLGFGIEGFPDVRLTDDYCNALVVVGDDIHRIETDGGLLILTAEELPAYIKAFEVDGRTSYEDDCAMGMRVIHDYVGDIVLEVHMSDGQEVLQSYGTDYKDAMLHHYMPEAYEDSDAYIEDVYIRFNADADIGPEGACSDFKVFESSSEE